MTHVYLPYHPPLLIIPFFFLCSHSRYIVHFTFNTFETKIMELWTLRHLCRGFIIIYTFDIPHPLQLTQPPVRIFCTDNKSKKNFLFCWRKFFCQYFKSQTNEYWVYLVFMWKDKRRETQEKSIDETNEINQNLQQAQKSMRSRRARKARFFRISNLLSFS